MISQPTAIGIYIGLGFGAVYLVLCLFAKQMPNFNKFATIVLSCVGAVVGIDFGHVALTSAESSLGVLSDQRLPIVLGAGAVVWLAIEQGLKVYHPLVLQIIEQRKPNKGVERDATR